MSSATKSHKPVKPVSGSVKLLRPFGAVNENTAEVLINGKPYYMTRTGAGYRLTGYDSRKGKTTVYDLPADLSGCDCPDATWRPEREGGCKHRAALIALQKAGKL
jgi:hypothetical protein